MNWTEDERSDRGPFEALLSPDKLQLATAALSTPSHHNITITNLSLFHHNTIQSLPIVSIFQLRASVRKESFKDGEFPLWGGFGMGGMGVDWIGLTRRGQELICGIITVGSKLKGHPDPT